MRFLLTITAVGASEVILSYRPLIVYFDNFADQDETDHMLKLLDVCRSGEWDSCKSVKSKLASGKESKLMKNMRNSTSFQLTVEGEVEDAVVESLVKRAHAAARHPINAGEGVQIAYYEKGDYYEFHHDALGRRATFLLYLNTLEPGDGGETIFPHLKSPGASGDPPLPPAITGKLGRWSADFKVDKQEHLDAYCDSPYYMKIRPKRGAAVLFFNYVPDRSIESFAYHGACKIKADKFKATFQRWMRFDPNSLFDKSEDERIISRRAKVGEDQHVPFAEPVEDTSTTSGGAPETHGAEI
mmetsp:Transcript_72142/g.192433  ORF Transcript_72142/g.192433 Transcript_72142/m.192433 type:complete len:299 (+) Transcript_72142:80-976(+)